jgi:hypothetical protein
VFSCRKSEAEERLEELQEVSAAASRGKSLLAAARSEAKDVLMQHATLLRAYQSLQAAHSSIKEQVDQVLIKSIFMFHVCDEVGGGLQLVWKCRYNVSTPHR